MITVIINIIFSIMEKAIVNIRMELIYFKENGDLNNFDNFQIYEWIGDTILGYHVSKILFKQYYAFDEGMLTLHRSKVVCNSNLTDVFLYLKLENIFLLNEEIKYCDFIEYLIGELENIGSKRAKDLLLKLISFIIYVSSLDSLPDQPFNEDEIKEFIKKVWDNINDIGLLGSKVSEVYSPEVWKHCKKNNYYNLL